MVTPLRRTAVLLRRTPGAEDAHGNPVVAFAAPVNVPAIWWPEYSQDLPLGGHERTEGRMKVVLDVDVEVSTADRLVLDGVAWDVFGDPASYEDGPWWSPGRQVVTCRKVAG